MTKVVTYTFDNSLIVRLFKPESHKNSYYNRSKQKRPRHIQIKTSFRMFVLFILRQKIQKYRRQQHHQINGYSSGDHRFALEQLPHAVSD